MQTYDFFLAVSYKVSCVAGSAYRRAIESILEECDRLGLTIYAAPVVENWGTNRPARRDAIANDHAALRECAHFVYFTGGYESDGALVELGMALSLNKRITILRWESENLPSHVNGFIEIGMAAEGIITTPDRAFVSLGPLRDKTPSDGA
jgi:hypothetical protein